MRGGFLRKTLVVYLYQWLLFLVPLITGGIGSIFHPTGSARTISGIFRGMTYLPIGGWTMPPTYHLLGEPFQQPLTANGRITMSDVQ